jgi:hypothetical protein
MPTLLKYRRQGVNPCQHCHYLGAPPLPPDVSRCSSLLPRPPPSRNDPPAHRGAAPQTIPLEPVHRGGLPRPPRLSPGSRPQRGRHIPPFSQPCVGSQPADPFPLSYRGKESPPPLLNPVLEFDRPKGEPVVELTSSHYQPRPPSWMDILD